MLRQRVREPLTPRIERGVADLLVHAQDPPHTGFGEPRASAEPRVVLRLANVSQGAEGC